MWLASITFVVEIIEELLCWGTLKIRLKRVKTVVYANNRAWNREHGVSFSSEIFIEKVLFQPDVGMFVSTHPTVFWIVKNSLAAKQTCIYCIVIAATSDKCPFTENSRLVPLPLVERIKLNFCKNNTNFPFRNYQLQPTADQPGMKTRKLWIKTRLNGVEKHRCDMGDIALLDGPTATAFATTTAARSCTVW